MITEEEDEKVTATDEMYDTAAAFLAKSERGTGKTITTKVAISSAGFDKLFIDSATHQRRVQRAKKRKLNEILSASTTNPPINQMVNNDGLCNKHNHDTSQHGPYQCKSLLTTMTTEEDKTVTATDEMYDTAAEILATAERSTGKAITTKVAMSSAGFDKVFIDSTTHQRRVQHTKKKKLDEISSASTTNPPISSI